MKGFSLCFFLHHAFHVGVGKRSPKLIVHTILDIYSRINLNINYSETTCGMGLILIHFVRD